MGQARMEKVSCIYKSSHFKLTGQNPNLNTYNFFGQTLINISFLLKSSMVLTGKYGTD